MQTHQVMPRYAIYYTPGQQHPLTQLAVRWLGRDAYPGGETLATPSHSTLVRLPSRYGFHATLKAPFRLLEGKTQADLQVALHDFARSHDSCPIGRVSLQQVSDFLALVPNGDCRMLNECVAHVVEELDSLRAPMNLEEFSRRFADCKDDGQRTNLIRWGYPHVFERFKFHMTLTDPLPANIVADTKSRLAAFLEDQKEATLTLDALSIFVQPDPGSDFAVLSQSILRDKKKSPQKSGRGRLIVVVGPSGAGKDTLINYAQDRVRGLAEISFIKRTITRAAGPGEDHEPVSEHEFLERESRGAFALSWKAHGLSYGIPATVDSLLSDGKITIVNGSRSALGQIRQKYPDVITVNITARPDILARRIAHRAREDAKSAHDRMTRKVTSDGHLATFEIDNSTSIFSAGEIFIEALFAIRRQGKCRLSDGRSQLQRNNLYNRTDRNHVCVDQREGEHGWA
jgi:phosphonate metabolism protein PhnN/1,5-bisphosphokinase (PRPP-forming)